MSDNFVVYHLHSEFSLLDSCTNYKLYVDKAVEYGQTAIGFSEHGNISSHIAKKMYCKEKGIKYLHGIEIYLTRTQDEKVRDNFHTILIARNYAGYLELNSLIELSSREDHKYYNDRISFDEFFGLSNNIIKISACLASPLNKIPEEDPIFERLIMAYDFLEVQPHVNSEDQKSYNKNLARWSKKFGIPLIAGTDTHSVNNYKAECRGILLKAKKKSYADEDQFDLTFKSYDELVEMFREQRCLPECEYMDAIRNTVVMSEMVEDFDIDTQFKYPKLYDDEEKIFWDRIVSMHDKKVADGIIKNNPRYMDRIKEEFDVFKKLKMIGFMLFMSELLCWCWDNDIPTSPCRGSVGGSEIAYITDITDVDPMVWDTVFSRFANESRLEIGDIDLDFAPNDRDRVYQYIIDRFGEEYTSYIMTNGTCVEKGTIDEICRAIGTPLDDAKKIKKEYATDPEKTRNKYPNIFYYFDGLVDTIISKGIHPAAIIISPIPLSENYGVYHYDGKRVITLNMDEVHEISLVKYDILGLKNVGVIKTCCELAGIKYPKSHEMNWQDDDVWKSISDSNIGVFQFESQYAGDCLKKFGAKTINDLSLVNAAIRPSGASYRDRLFDKQVNKNPSKLIDDMLKDNYGFLCFQEDTLKFLQHICGLSGSEADNVRRAIGRKQKDRLENAIPSILEGYCEKSTSPREVAEKEAHVFLQIISDSSDYQFNYNHSTGYSMLGYYCLYMRHYYPLEFCAALLNNASNEDDISDGTQLCKIYKIKVNPIRFRRSKSEYFIDKETNSIYKGIGSVKYLSGKIADELYALRDERFNYFYELLLRLKDTSVDSRQLNILTKLSFWGNEFFSGNTKKMIAMIDAFNMMGKGDSSYISKDKIHDQHTYDIVAKYSTDTNKDGSTSLKFTIKDMTSILRELELRISDMDISDFDLRTRIKHEMDYLGYVSSSQKQEERNILFVKDVYPLHRKKDGVKFGQSVVTVSIGSGMQSRFTLFDRDVSEEIKAKDIIKCIRYERDKNGYFNLLEYEII